MPAVSSLSSVPPSLPRSALVFMGSTSDMWAERKLWLLPVRLLLWTTPHICISFQIHWGSCRPLLFSVLSNSCFCYPCLSLLVTCLHVGTNIWKYFLPCLWDKHRALVSVKQSLILWGRHSLFSFAWLQKSPVFLELLWSQCFLNASHRGNSANNPFFHQLFYHRTVKVTRKKTWREAVKLKQAINYSGCIFCSST